jgi:hypothetical protein
LSVLRNNLILKNMLNNIVDWHCLLLYLLMYVQKLVGNKKNIRTKCVLTVTHIKMSFS